MKGLETKLVVVGATIEALRYAKGQQDCHVIFTTPEPPHELSATPEEQQEWVELLFDLSMDGKIPLGAKINSIRLMGEKNFRVILQNLFFNIQFEKAVVFSDKNLEGLPTPTTHKQKYKVMDWITMRDGMTHQHKRIDCDDSEFVNHIIFYPTKRLDGHHPDKKDAVAISYMREENLNDVLWSDSYARLKAMRLMKDAGIKFSSNKVEVSHREVLPMNKVEYPSSEFVEFR